MNTLIVFLIVFVPMSWFIWRMLRFTRDTIGTNSPMKVSRIYKTTGWSFFTRIENMSVYYSIIAGFFLTEIALFAYFPPTQDYQGLIRFFMLVFGSLLLTFAATVLAVDFNHWNYVRGMTIETFPEEHELEIAFPDVVLRLKEDDIEKMQVYHNDNHRLPLAYMECYLTNGDHFIISGKTSGQWVIMEYFKKIPVEFIIRRFPFVK